MDRDIWCLKERGNYITMGCRVAFLSRVKENNRYRTCYCEGTVVRVVKNIRSQSSVGDQVLYYIKDMDDDHDLNSNGQHNKTNENRLTIDKILPLPTLDAVSIARRKVFKPNDRVLALFPGTTCFYPATVLQQPNRVE